jgi:hypothetical protein
VTAHQWDLDLTEHHAFMVEGVDNLGNLYIQRLVTPLLRVDLKTDKHTAWDWWPLEASWRNSVQVRPHKPAIHINAKVLLLSSYSNRLLPHPSYQPSLNMTT